ncbi:MAG TPA: leucine--tRNA ligase [Candidatus Paceibacterota bacterium]|nr:leucine--tRNA ligase [Candidatus Paceibacterota bacterium]
MKRYNHQSLEKKWQKEWERKGIYKAESTSRKKKMYVLDMFPYPSGTGLHVGHPRGYIASDIYARLKRMQGFNVLHPMGFDSFGLPAEQYAIQTGKHPGPFTETLIRRYKQQLSIMGLSYDWSREVATHRPDYYKWTQWIFLKLFDAYYDAKKNKARATKELVKEFEKKGNKNSTAVCDTDTPIFSAKEWKSFSKPEQEKVLMKYRLAYEGYSEVNWCPELGTVLANDEVVDGPNGTLLSERGNFPVEKRKMRQWFLRISAYAERLLQGLEAINWSLAIKEIQRNWIGKSEGSEIPFILSNGETVTVFTTRADTLFGATYLVLAPEHALVQTLRPYIRNWEMVEKYIHEVANKPDEVRSAEAKEKTGVVLEGVTVINPATKEQIPVWIADYVLASYGTGAVMAVPAHDERDFAFAKKYNLSIRHVIFKDGTVAETEEKPFCEYGITLNSGEFSGLTSEEAKVKITKVVGGKIVTKYKMRDAVFARQRYWGEPIPLVHKSDGTIVPLAENKLPLKLPNVKSYKPSGTGESPLANIKEWVQKGYETNTMPGWAASSWYFIRYMDPKNKKAFASKQAIKYWKNVDVYIGGTEHATGHLLYARFWHKFLYDLGLVPTEEPFQQLKNQGMILGADNRKMSKRWGNVVNPDDVVKTYGADTLRLFESFIGPFEASLPWSTEGIIGSRRFIERIWKLAGTPFAVKPSEQNEKLLHKTIKKVTEDIESFNFNTAVSAMMIFTNSIEGALTKKQFGIFVRLLAPFAPYVAEELWQQLGEKKSIHLSVWPVWDKKKVIEDTVTIMVQVNGKIRGQFEAPVTIAPEAAQKIALGLEKVAPHLAGKKVKKVISLPQKKIVNIVV